MIILNHFSARMDVLTESLLLLLLSSFRPPASEQMRSQRASSLFEEQVENFPLNFSTSLSLKMSASPICALNESIRMFIFPFVSTHCTVINSPYDEEASTLYEVHGIQE